MRVLELQRIDAAWRMWAVSNRATVPPATPLTQYLAWPEPEPVPATYAKWEGGTTFVVDGYTPPAPPAPSLPARMSRLAFQSRYTVTEQVAIELAADGTTPGFTPEQRATLRVLDRALQNATDVDLADPRTVQGVQMHAALGLLTAQRAAQILDPSWTPGA